MRLPASAGRAVAVLAFCNVSQILAAAPAQELPGTAAAQAGRVHAARVHAVRVHMTDGKTLEARSCRIEDGTAVIDMAENGAIGFPASRVARIEAIEIVAPDPPPPQAQAPAPEGPQEMTREESEKRQSLWWYLLLAGLMLLAAETMIANRLSRKEKFL